MARRKRSSDFFRCPHCGAKVAVGASFCRRCGASEESGWSDEDDAAYAEGGYDEDDFDYDEYLAREFPEHAPSRASPRRWLTALLVAALCLAILLWTVLG